MPRNVRNFWIEAQIDGRTSNLSGGPARKDGGFSLRVYQRNDGNVQHVLTIQGHRSHREDGPLILFVVPTQHACDNLHLDNLPPGFSIRTRR